LGCPKKRLASVVKVLVQASGVDNFYREHQGSHGVFQYLFRVHGSSDHPGVAVEEGELLLMVQYLA
jgi:hypothetical protein